MKTGSRRTAFQKAAILLGSLLMTLAPGLDMTVHAKLKPDAVDPAGYLYQAIGRTLSDLSADSITVALAFFTVLWLARRYLFRKPRETHVGEYALCGFLSVMMLACASVRATGSVQTLYANVFQGLKATLYLAGMFPLFLCALRGLNELLHRTGGAKTVPLWDRHPFGFPLAVLGLAWVGQVIVKYPGVINLDEVMPIRQYIGLTARSTDFPVLGTLIYGLAYTLGQRIGDVNVPYFALMLAQVVSLACVLAYAQWLMRTKDVPAWIRVSSLVLFAVSPVYIGWAVAISKDGQYMILLILMGVLTIEFLSDAAAFFRRKSRWVLLALCFALTIFTRYNGAYVVAPVALLFLLTMLRRRLTRKTLLRFVAVVCLVFVLCAGVSEAIIRTLGMQKIQFYDWLSIPFQQTARVAQLYGGDGLTQQDKDDIGTMIDYDQLAGKYTAHRVDPVKTTVSVTDRGSRTPARYLRVWWKQLRQYPIDYLDAALNMNYYLFDLQSNVPVYNSYSDIAQYTYPYAFHETEFFNLEEIRPLLSAQLALTEWYFDFSDLPVVGWFASMGFCVDIMIAMAYLAWVNRRKAVLIAMVPSLLTAFAGLFCPEVYVRYLLPTIGSLPLWFAAYAILRPAADRPASLRARRAPRRRARRAENAERLLRGI